MSLVLVGQHIAQITFLTLGLRSKFILLGFNDQMSMFVQDCSRFSLGVKHFNYLLVF